MRVVTDDDMHASPPCAASASAFSDAEGSSAPALPSTPSARAGASAAFNLNACLLAADGFPINFVEGEAS